MRGVEVVSERLEDVVEYRERDERRLERCVERRLVGAGPRVEHVAFDAGREARGHRVLQGEVRVGVALVGGAPDGWIRAGEKPTDGALRDVLLSFGPERPWKLPVGVGEHAVRGDGTGQRV